VRPCRVLLEVAALAVLPSLALAENLGATRVPPQVESARGGTDLSDPGALDSDGTGPAQVYGLKPGTSKTLGSGVKDADTRRIENTAAGLAPGGVIGVDVPGAAEIPDQTRPTTSGLPELHVVQKGDTLWSLCSKYFGDPWRWPRLWAQNPIITNPHWIFPGDVIKLGEGSGSASVAPLGSPPPGPARSGMVSVNRVTANTDTAVMLRELGFIEAKDLEQAATIGGSREEKMMLATGDQAYLRYPKRSTIRAGERYSVFETDLNHPVVDSTTGKTYGYMVRVLGDLIVNQITEEEVARGTLVDTVSPIERGARVSAFVHQFKRIEPKPSEVTLEARVIGTFAPNQLLGFGHFVILNRGKRDGVQVGNRTFVIRRGDGYRANLERWEIHDPKSPKEVVGEILVVDVRDDASVAWIARSSKELKVGELTEMRKGH
jgi:hypothetical protein